MVRNNIVRDSCIFLVHSNFDIIGNSMASTGYNSLQPLNVNNKVFLNRAKGVKPKMEVEGDGLKLPKAVETSSPLEGGAVGFSERPKTNNQRRKVDFDNKMPDLRSSN